MRPSQTINNAVNKTTGHTEPTRKGDLRCARRGIAPYFAHIVWRQFRDWMVLATHLLGWIGFAIATFGDHIVHIIGLCAEKQMFRAYAQLYIAAMANDYAAWDWTIDQIIGKAVRQNLLTFAHAESSVSGRVTIIEPKPALTRPIDLRPESLYNIFRSCGRGILDGHVNLQLMCHATGGLQPRRGFVMPNYTTLAGVL